MILETNPSGDDDSVLPFIRIPDYIVKLAKIRSLSKPDYHKVLGDLLQKHKDFKLIIEKIHPEIQPSEKKITEIYERYGREHFLDLAISTMIYKKKTGQYLSSPDIKPCTSVLEFVDEIRPYTSSSNTRLHLLGYYLFLASFDTSNKFKLTDNHPTNFIQSLKILLNSFQSKILEIDYFIIILKFFHDLIPAEKLNELIENKANYIEFYRQIDSAGQIKLQYNFLNYANSIHESYHFYQKVV